VGRFKALIKSYLTERYQRVIIQNNSKSSYSDWKIIKHGLPQGSILGPLFFIIIYKRPAPNELENTSMVLYADDTSLVITGTNLAQFSVDVNTVFNNVNEWFRSNLMFLNNEKTHFLQFWTKNSQKIDLNITLAEEYITNTSYIKFFGLIIDKNLSWKCHIEQALIKLSSACYAMKVVTPLMGDKTLRMIYFAYVHFLLSYGIILWGNSSHS
jgi:hypothetical protein